MAQLFYRVILYISTHVSRHWFIDFYQTAVTVLLLAWRLGRQNTTEKHAAAKLQLTKNAIKIYCLAPEFLMVQVNRGRILEQKA